MTIMTESTFDVGKGSTYREGETVGGIGAIVSLLLRLTSKKLLADASLTSMELLTGASLAFLASLLDLKVQARDSLESFDSLIVCGEPLCTEVP